MAAEAFLGCGRRAFCRSGWINSLFNDRSQPRPPPSSPSSTFVPWPRRSVKINCCASFLRAIRRCCPCRTLAVFLAEAGWTKAHWLTRTQFNWKSRYGWSRPSLSGVPTSLSRFVSGMISNFGTDFLGNPSGTGSIPSERVEQPPSREDPWPVFLAPEVSPARSILRLQGGLIDRLLGGLPALQNWPGESLLTNSVVQIAVSPLGEVMAARLVTSCGLAEADSEAVNTARTLRFRAERSAGTKWGDAIFQWHMIEPAAVGPAK